MSYKKLNQINNNTDSFLSNIKFSNPDVINNNRRNRNSSCNITSDKHYLLYNIQNESSNICFSSNKAALCKDIIKDNKSCCC